MMKLTSWLLAGLLVAAPAAWAGNCPNLMTEIDEILASSSVDEEAIVDEEMGKSVRELRDEGEALHESGQHAESVEVLERALKLLEEETG